MKIVVFGDIHGRPFWKDIIEKEALTDNAKSCKILSAELGDSIGDFASLGLLF